MTIRVVIADDDALIRRAISMMLRAQPDIEIVAEVPHGRAAVAAVEELHPDVAILDVRMPHMDGVEATRLITANRAAAPANPGVQRTEVLVLTTFADESVARRALDAGALGFLYKATEPEVFVEAIRAVAAGGGSLDPTITRQLIEQFVRRPVGATMRDDRLGRLTPTERIVLAHIAKGLSNAEIARQMYISEGTVKTHVSHVLDKLELRDRQQATTFAYESGFVSASGD